MYFTLPALPTNRWSYWKDQPESAMMPSRTVLPAQRLPWSSLLGEVSPDRRRLPGHVSEIRVTYVGHPATTLGGVSSRMLTGGIFSPSPAGRAIIDIGSGFEELIDPRVSSWSLHRSHRAGIDVTRSSCQQFLSHDCSTIPSYGATVLRGCGKCLRNVCVLLKYILAIMNHSNAFPRCCNDLTASIK